MRLNKKGSLELSVNAIVVLIIALTILGLVIAFAVSKFTEVSGKLDTNTPPTASATAEIPVQFPGGSNEITLSKTKDSTMAISVYNSETTDLTAALSVSCADQVAGTNLFTFSAPATTISSGKSAQIPVKMSVVPATTTGRYACTLSTAGPTAPVFITVK